MSKFVDLTGQRFGRLTVIERTENRTYVGTKQKYIKVRWRCLCDCGNITIVNASDLKKGSIKSCGCLKREMCYKKCKEEKLSRKTHGESRGGPSRLYAVWKGMKSRCNYPKHIGFRNYGGRGITVCEEWSKDYSAFQDWAMANGYDPDAPFGECTLDRINVDGNYCPENCRWVSTKEQAKNKRDSRHKEE